MEQLSNDSEKRFKRKLFCLFLIVLATLFLFGLIPKLINTHQVNDLAEEKPSVRARVLQIKPNTQAQELVLPSSADAWHITPIWARVSGYLLKYHVDIGDVVKAGNLLAEIDTPETDEELARAKADLVNSQAERDIAKITAERWQKLWDKNREAVSKQEVDQYSANLKSTEAMVVANEKNVSRLTYEQQFKNIYAPFDGIIIQRNTDIGALIYGNLNAMPQELFRIAQAETIRFFVQVPQTYYRQIKVGLKAEVTIDQWPEQVFKGSVTRFAKALDPVARTLLTEVDVENKEGLLYPGLFSKVKFYMHPETVNFIIPTTALIIRRGLPHVAVVDQEEIVHFKQVTIGLDYGKQIEITQGLKEDEKIIVLPSDAIKEGVKVKSYTTPTG